MGNVVIACDTVRRDRGCSGADVNGVAVGFVLLADTFDDPENARIILLSAAGLAVLGLLIAAATVWWWRSSEIEHPALGPLEVMGSRSWWKGDFTSRRRELEAARPEGAEPADPPATSTSDPVDLEAAALASPREFDDLLEFPAVETADPVVEPSLEPSVEVAATGGAAAADAEGVAEAGVETPAVETPAVETPVEEAQVEEVAAVAVAEDADVSSELTQDDTSFVDVRRPIDPILRQQHDDDE